MLARRFARFARIANFVTPDSKLPPLNIIHRSNPFYSCLRLTRERSVVPLFLQGNSTRDEEISRRQADLRGPCKIPRLNTAGIRARGRLRSKCSLGMLRNVRRKISRDANIRRSDEKFPKVVCTPNDSSAGSRGQKRDHRLVGSLEGRIYDATTLREEEEQQWLSVLFTSTSRLRIAITVRRGGSHEHAKLAFT